MDGNKYLREVIGAAKTKPFGFMQFLPGSWPGRALIPLAIRSTFLEGGQFWAMGQVPVELAGEINTSMPKWVVAKIAEALNGDFKALERLKGPRPRLGYKANIDDDRESPSYAIITLYSLRVRFVDYCDPFFLETPNTRKHNLRMRSIPLDNDAWREYDVVVVCTAHDAFKDASLFNGLRLVVDTRNLLDMIPSGDGPARVIKA